MRRFLFAAGLAVLLSSSVLAQGSQTWTSTLSLGATFPGHLFQVDATESIRIWRVGTPFSDATTRMVSVWYRPGGIGTGTTDPGWIFIGSTNVTPPAADTQTQVPVDINQVVTQGNSIGIALCCHTGNLRYTGGTGPAQTAWGISIPTGSSGFQYAPAPPWGTPQTPRQFAGSLWYDPAGPTLTAGATLGTAQTVFSNSQGPGGNGLSAGMFSVASSNDPNSILEGIEITASGTGNDATAISEVRIYADTNASGTFEFGTDLEVSTAPGTFPSDNGVINFSVATAHQAFPASTSRDYFVVAKLNGSALPGQTFSFEITDISHPTTQYSTILAASTMAGLVIDTPQFVFTDSSQTSPVTVYLTFSGVCQEFSIAYPAGPDDKPASLTVNSLGTADEAADLASTQLWWDSDNDSTFTAADTLVDTQMFTMDNGSVTFSLASQAVFQAGQTRTYFVVHALNANAGNNETFRCYVNAMGAAPLGGVASGLPLPNANGTEGLEVSAAILFGIMNGPVAPATVDSNANGNGDGELLADATLRALPGGAWEIGTMIFNAAGTGNHNSAYLELALYEDTGGTLGAWDGPTVETLAAPFAAGFTANVASFNLINTTVPAGLERRFFLVAMLSGTAPAGATFGARLTGVVPTNTPAGGQQSGFPTPASTALVIDVPALSVANAPEQPAPATHAAGAAGELVAAAFRLNALNGATTVNGITFTTSGTGDWTSDVNATTGVAVYRDNGDGVYSPTDDAFLTETGGASPIVTTSFNLPLTTGEIADLWVVIRLTATAGQGIAATPETFIVSINDPSTDVSATNPATTGMPAPAGVAVGAIEFNVTNFDPATAQQSGTQPITITGSGFMMPFTVVIGGTACPGTPVIAGGTQVTGLTVPPGVGINMPIIIHSGTLPPQTLTQTFTYIAPKDNDPPKSDDGGSCSGDTGARWPLAALFAGALLMGVAMMLRRRSA